MCIRDRYYSLFPATNKLIIFAIDKGSDSMESRQIHIINGPNLNMLGTREPEIYGSTPFDEYLERLRALFPAWELVYLQSNHEGDLIDYMQSLSLLHI